MAWTAKLIFFFWLSMFRNLRAFSPILRRRFSPSFVPSASFQETHASAPTIVLSPEEAELFQILDEAAQQNGASTTLRIAGGWVRDKLLAQANDPSWQQGNDGESGSNSMGADVKTFKRDIDVAIDDQLGSHFADKLNAYLLARGEDGVAVGMVMRNPDKSKHLETATMNIRGFSIDFVNLRTEEYSDTSSRIPVMDIGTPSEDAFRRDLTINSLFYNLRSRALEDFTGRGLDDLSRRIISTPLPPKVTLLDDPLRLLRAVRFATRLGFQLAENLLDAAGDTDEVREALAEKVSRERIGIEFDLMLSTPQPPPLGEGVHSATAPSSQSPPIPSSSSTTTTLVDGVIEPAKLRALRLAESLKGPVRAIRLLHALGAFPTVLREPAALYCLPRNGISSRRDSRTMDEVDRQVSLHPLRSNPNCEAEEEAIARRERQKIDRFSLALQSIESADALLYNSRHALMRRTLGCDYSSTSNGNKGSSNSSTTVERSTKAMAPAPNKQQAKLSQIRHVTPEYERRVVLYSSMLLPWARLRASKDDLKKADSLNSASIAAMECKYLTMDHTVPASRYILSEGLKLRMRDAEDVEKVHEAAARFARLLLEPCRSDDDDGSAVASKSRSRRAEAGQVLRYAGPLWRAAILVAIVDHIIDFQHANSYMGDEEGSAECKENVGRDEKEEVSGPSLVEIANKGASSMADVLSVRVTREMQASAMYAFLVKWMDDEGLLGSTVSIHRAVTGKPGLAAWEMTPLFNGNEVCKILPKLPRGPAIGEVIDAMVTWQLTEKEVYTAVAELQATATQSSDSAVSTKGSRAAKSQAGSAKDSERGRGKRGDAAMRTLRPVEELCAAFLRTQFPSFCAEEESANEKGTSPAPTPSPSSAVPTTLS